eukprot:g5183.t1
MHKGLKKDLQSDLTEALRKFCHAIAAKAPFPPASSNELAELRQGQVDLSSQLKQVQDLLATDVLVKRLRYQDAEEEAQGRGFRGEALSSGYQSAMAACAAEEKWGVVHGLFEEMQKEMTADVESYRLAMEASHGLKCPGNTIELLRSAEEQEVEPSNEMLNLALKACAATNSWAEALQILGRFRSRGVAPDADASRRAIDLLSNRPGRSLRSVHAVMFSACLSICRDPNGVDSEEIAQSTDFNPQFEDSATGRRVDRPVEGRRTTSTVQEEIVDTATLRDPKPVGVLRVSVIEGRHLYGNDSHLFSNPTSDPYVRIRLADDETRRTSPNAAAIVRPESWVKLPDGRPPKNSPMTSINAQRLPAPSGPGDTPAERSEKRLDIEYVMCFQLSKEATADPLEIHLIAQDQVTLGVGRINLEEVMNSKDKQKEWIEEPLELERPPEDGNFIPDFLNRSTHDLHEAAPARCEVTVSARKPQKCVTSHRVAEQEDNDPPLDSTPTRARHAQVDVTSAVFSNETGDFDVSLFVRRKRCQQAEEFRMPSQSNSLNRWQQPLVGRDTTKCTGSVESLDSWMQASVPKLLKGMYFNKFKLGGKSPVFGPIKISEAPERWGKEPGKDNNQGSEIRLGVKLDSESQIELTIMAVKVGIHRLQVRGEIAIRFEPLLGQTPALVMPNVISVPIGSEEKGVDRSLLRHPRPLGIVRVRAKSASGLPGARCRSRKNARGESWAKEEFCLVYERWLEEDVVIH